MGFSEDIMAWYALNRRELPWRSTRDPYKIWLSEIILQQTRVAQGLPYYQKFIANFPTVFQLAAASESEVLKLWQGLGYYSRARNLHATARTIQAEMDGRFPETYDGLISLRGVGDYTASAIASICYGLPEPVVDGNVYRVLSRYFGIDLPIDSSQGKKYFRALAREVMDRQSAGTYNQAIMDFGARQCVPASPDCTVCPLKEGCIAYGERRVAGLPVKKGRQPVRRRYFNYLVPLDAGRNTLLQQRTDKGIWQQLYEFPLLESVEQVAEEHIASMIPESLIPNRLLEIEPGNEEEIVHKLSHQHLHTRFWILHLEGHLQEGVGPEELDSYPVPVLIADFIKTLKNSYF